METVNKKQSIYKWMRLLHRDIGFFVIGLTIIYCSSGILLTYRDTGFLKNETFFEKSFEPGLTSKQLIKALGERKLKVLEESDKEIRFTNGTYHIDTGEASYTKHEIPPALKALTRVHVAPSKDAKHLFTILYATSLLFLAVSSFWMYRPNSKHFKRAIVTSTIGVLASILLVII